METPRYNTQDTQEICTSNINEQEEDQIIAGLYQDIDADIEDRFSGSFSSKQIGLTKSNKTKNFRFSIPIHNQKFIDQKSPTPQYFTAIKAEASPNGLSSSTKCGMDSPSFCKGDSDAFNLVFPVLTGEDAPRDTQQPVRQGLLSDSEIKSPDGQESVKERLMDSIKTNTFKAPYFSEEQNGKKHQNSLSLSKSTSLNACIGPVFNLYGQKSDRASSTRSIGYEKNSAHQRIPVLFPRKAAGILSNDFERPESSPELDRSCTTGEALQTSRTVGVEVSHSEIADPLSLGNFDEKFQRLRSKPVSVQVSSRKNIQETKAQIPAQIGQSLKSSKSSSNLKETNVKKGEKVPVREDNSKNTLYKTILSQPKRPKEIEIAISSLEEYQLKPEQKSGHIKSSKNADCTQASKVFGGSASAKQSNESTLKTWKVATNGSSSPKKNRPNMTTGFFKDLQGHIAQNGNSSPKRGTIGAKLGFGKETGKSSPTNKSSSKLMHGSPKTKSSQSQKTWNSIVPKSVTAESPTAKRKQHKNAKLSETEKSNKPTEIEKKTQKTKHKIKGIPLDKSTEEMTDYSKLDNSNNVRAYTEGEKSLQHYLDQEKIQPLRGETGENEKRLEVIEANLREIQGKNFLRSGSPKHIRYPSFGSGSITEKERRPSSRRTISQDAQCAQALQQFIQPGDREKNLKEFSVTKSLSKMDVSTKSMPKLQIPLNQIEEGSESQSPPIKKQQVKEKLSYNSLMKSLNLRKNLVTNQEQNTAPLSARSQRAQVNTSLDVNSMDLIPPSVGSGSTISSKITNKYVVDIYQRNSQWLSLKQDKIQQIELVKKKEEMKECTFKPSKNIGFNVESEYSQKSFNNYGINRLKSEASQSPEKRSVSKEKKNLNSYNGIYNLRKEVLTPKTEVPRSPKSKYFGRKEAVEAIVIRTNPN